MRDRMINTCGDSHITVGQSKKFDTCLRLYTRSHAMCIDNSKLKKFKLGNGTLCHVISIRLQNNAPLQWKNQDGYKVYTISEQYCEYVEFEHFPENER